MVFGSMEPTYCLKMTAIKASFRTLACFVAPITSLWKSIISYMTVPTQLYSQSPKTKPSVTTVLPLADSKVTTTVKPVSANWLYLVLQLVLLLSSWIQLPASVFVPILFVKIVSMELLTKIIANVILLFNLKLSVISVATHPR